MSELFTSSESKELPIDYAMEYASRGIPVFPCSSDKIPLVAKGLYAATCDREKVKEWWSDNPDAEIGIPTGKASGVFVVDLDRKEGGPDCIENYMEILSNSEVTRTPISTTPSGGLHIFYRYEHGVRNSVSKLAPGIDVRGEGGYILAPSGQSGRKWNQDLSCELAEAPQELLEALRRLTSERPPSQSGSVEIGSEAPAHVNNVVSYAEAALEHEVRELASAAKGSRNSGLNTAAFRLQRYIRTGDLDKANVVSRLEEACRENGLVADDGLRRVQKTIESGLTGGAKLAVPSRAADPQADTLDEPLQRRFTLLGPGDFCRVSEKPWLISDVLGEGDLSILIGSPGVGKSRMSANMCSSVASGQDWFGRAVQHGGVLYVAAERGAAVQRTIHAEMHRHGLADPPIRVISDSISLGSSEADVEALLRAAEEAASIPTFEDAGGLRLIVIDTLSQAYGDGNENDSRDMRTFLNRIDRLQRQTGAHVMLVHHVPLDGSVRPRGHSSLLGAADTVLSVKVRESGRTVSLTKQNEAQDRFSFHFEITNYVCELQEQLIEVGLVQQCSTWHAPEEEYNEIKQRLTGIAKRMFELLQDFCNRRGNNAIQREELYRLCIEEGVTKGSNSDNQRRALQRIENKLVEEDHINVTEKGMISVTDCQVDAVAA